MGQTSHHTACMRQRAVPPGTGRCQKGACTGGLHSAAEARGVPHTVQFMRKMRKVCFTENRTHCLMYEVYDLPTGPKRLDTSKLSGNGLKMVRNETHVPRYPGYFEYSEYPPSEGQSHPGRPGPLRAWVGAPRPGPIQVPESRFPIPRFKFPIQVPDSRFCLPGILAGVRQRIGSWVPEAGSPAGPSTQAPHGG